MSMTIAESNDELGFAWIPMVMSMLQSKGGDGGKSDSSANMLTPILEMVMGRGASRNPPMPSTPGYGVQNAGLTFCPQGFVANPTWGAIPPEQRAQAAAAGVQACLPLNPQRAGAGAAACRPGFHINHVYGVCYDPMIFPDAQAALTAFRQGTAPPGSVAHLHGGSGGRAGRSAARPSPYGRGAIPMPMQAAPARGRGVAARSGKRRRRGLHGSTGMDIGGLAGAFAGAASAAEGSFYQRHSTALIASGLAAVAAGIGVAVARSRRHSGYAFGGPDLYDADLG